MHRFGVAVRRVGLRAHCFRFSACTASEWPLGELVLPPSVLEIALGGLAFGLTASAFRHALIRSCPRRVGLRAHCFRFLVRTASELPLGEFVLPPSASELPSAGWPSGSPLPLFGTHRFGDCPRRVGLRVHCFRFSARTASELPSAGWPSGSLLPLFGTHRFGVALGGLGFGLTASAFRHAPIRSDHWASSFFRLPLRSCPRWVGLRAHCFRFSACATSELPSASWPSGSLLPLFGMRRFGDGRRASWPSGSLLPLFGMRRSAPPRR